MQTNHFLVQYGRWAIVTGASDGIGKAIAHELAHIGMNIVLVARRRHRLEQLAGELMQAHDIETRILDVDLSHSDGINALINGSHDLDVGLLVASAGYATTGNFMDIPLEHELNMFDLNARGVLELAHHFGKRFAQQGRGGIILMSSIVAFQGVPRSANYAASKAYVQTLGEGLRAELAPYGVDVLLASPGPVQSGFAQRADMQMGMALQPATVARETLRTLGKKTTVRPGWLSKFLIGSLSFLPRDWRIRAMSGVMKNMTDHQTTASPDKVQGTLS